MNMRHDLNMNTRHEHERVDGQEETHAEQRHEQRLRVECGERRRGRSRCDIMAHEREPGTSLLL